MLLQKVFLTQYLTMEQPNGCTQIDQKDPIWEVQELTKQDKRKCHINGISAESKNAGRDEAVGMVLVDANPKTLPKRNNAPQ